MGRFFGRGRSARRGEAYIEAYEFPSYIRRRVSQRVGLDAEDWALVERGLRDWFICCAWRGRRTLGMPSRVVDEAWHELILDSFAYMEFCDAAFGQFLHHTPDDRMSTPMPDALLAS